MSPKTKLNIVWLRRDLRLEDNPALIAAAKSEIPVLVLFIFDKLIIENLREDDARITFIYHNLEKIHKKLTTHQSQILIKQGDVLSVWQELINTFHINAIYSNEDYEPYALKRDNAVKSLVEKHKIDFFQFQDHVIFKPGEILKQDKTPYTVFTPFKVQWLIHFDRDINQPLRTPETIHFVHLDSHFPSLKDFGFKESDVVVPEINWEAIKHYELYRDFPAMDATTHIGTHLRFGTISIRQAISKPDDLNQTWLSELIWREFFIHILYFFPESEKSNFRAKYNNIIWNNDTQLFEKWKAGKTGFALVDAGMRELQKTGYMHNRVRMLCASFLCKDLLIDWRWGEAYFAEHLLDFESASNVGNWQWAAGTGCDAAPYFRVFNPDTQQKKFDEQNKYVDKWISEYNSDEYPKPIVDHKAARIKAIERYKQGLK